MFARVLAAIRDIARWQDLCHSASTLTQPAYTDRHCRMQCTQQCSQKAWAGHGRLREGMAPFNRGGPGTATSEIFLTIFMQNYVFWCILGHKMCCSRAVHSDFTSVLVNKISLTISRGSYYIGRSEIKPLQINHCNCVVCSAPSPLPVKWCTTHCWDVYVTCPTTLLLLAVYAKHFFSPSTNACSILEAFVTVPYKSTLHIKLHFYAKVLLVLWHCWLGSARKGIWPVKKCHLSESFSSGTSVGRKPRQNQQT